MEQRFNLSRPNTVSFDIPDLNGSRSHYSRVASEAVVNYGRSGFHCFQARGMKTFLISFKSQVQAIQAIEDGFRFEGSLLPLQAVTSGTTWLNINELPFELPDSRISRALAFYGDVKRVEHVKVDPKIGDFYTGDRRVLIDMKKRVPNILSIDGHEAVIWYKDVARLCRRCGQVGHNAADCSTPAHRPKKCLNCGNRWHEIDNCPGCKTCHTEAHTPEACPVIFVKIEPADEALISETADPMTVTSVSPNLENTPVTIPNTVSSPAPAVPSPPKSEVEKNAITDFQMESCEESRLPSSDSSQSSEQDSEPIPSPSPPPSPSPSVLSEITSVETAATALYKHRTPTSSWKNRNYRALSSVQEENITKYRFEPLIIAMIIRMDKKIRNAFIKSHIIALRAEEQQDMSKRFHSCPPSPPSC